MTPFEMFTRHSSSSVQTQPHLRWWHFRCCDTTMQDGCSTLSERFKFRGLSNFDSLVLGSLRKEGRQEFSDLFQAAFTFNFKMGWIQMKNITQLDQLPVLGALSPETNTAIDWTRRELEGRPNYCLSNFFFFIWFYSFAQLALFVNHPECIAQMSRPLRCALTRPGREIVCNQVPHFEGDQLSLVCSGFKLVVMFSSVKQKGFSLKSTVNPDQTEEYKHTLSLSAFQKNLLKNLCQQKTVEMVYISTGCVAVCAVHTAICGLHC